MGTGEVDLVEGDKKGAESHLPDICGWMAGWSPLLSSCAWMVSTTRLKRLLGPDGMKIIPDPLLFHLIHSNVKKHNQSDESLVSSANVCGRSSSAHLTTG